MDISPATAVKRRRMAFCDQRVTRGQASFRVHCTGCHGESAGGDGPMVGFLKIRPPDLTLLTRRHAGGFPRDRVAAAIDGREEIPGHGARRMPVWGITFQQLDRDADRAGEVQERIVDLVAFLESIQSGE